MIMYCEDSDTFEEAINRLSKGAFRELDFYGNTMSAMQILNISNIEDLRIMDLNIIVAVVLNN